MTAEFESGSSRRRRRSSRLKGAVPCLLAILSMTSVEAGRGDPGMSLPGGVPAGGPFDPPGTLYDNGQSDGTIAIGSQDGDNSYTSRAADEFILPAGPCLSGRFDIDGIRMHLVQGDFSPQPFGLEIYEDDGTGTSPSPVDAISPIAAYPETAQVLLGLYDPGLTIFEVSFDTAGLTLQADTTYWISGFGTDNVANSLGFENFFASSEGAMGTAPNGVFINPGRLADTWTRVEILAGGPPLHFAFAIDGSCQEEVFSDGFESGATDAWSGVTP